MKLSRRLYELLIQKTPGRSREEKTVVLDLIIVTIIFLTYASPLPAYSISAWPSVLGVVSTIFILFIIPILIVVYLRGRLKYYSSKTKKYREQMKKTSKP